MIEEVHELLTYLRRWTNARLLTRWRARGWDEGWALDVQITIGALLREMASTTSVLSMKLGARVERLRGLLIDVLAGSADPRSLETV